VSVSNGSLSAISNLGGLVRTATFTPNLNLSGVQANISVAAGTYEDAARNAGGAGTSPSIFIDTLAPAAAVTGLISIGDAPFDLINAAEKDSLTIKGANGAVEATGLVNIDIEGINNKLVTIRNVPATNLGAFVLSGTVLREFSDGPVVFKFTVVDAVGNTGSSASMNATLDATPPSASITKVSVIDNNAAGTGVKNAIQYGPTGVLGSSEYTSTGVTGVFATDDSAPTVKVLVTGILGGTSSQDIVAIYGGASKPSLTPANLIATGMIGASELEFPQLNIGRGTTVSPGPYVFVIRVEDLAGNAGPGQPEEVIIELTGVLGGGG